MSDDDLLIRCDSLPSLIRHREARGLTAPGKENTP